MNNTSNINPLEHEALYIFREVVAQFEKPVLLFSGGKDSITLVRLAQKAFFPAKIPFPLMHIDTGHNFPETIIEEFKFDACIGGARRDEEKARAKERVFSVRDDFGQWDEKNQRPELFDMLNGERDGLIWSSDDRIVYRDEDEKVEDRVVRFRTVGDMSCTAAVLSTASNIDSVVEEIKASSISERGARIDDKRSEAAMEKRKQQGYF